jgi:excisionase family DNA binding protein
MVQGYYTLEEAAHILGTTADELKQMSKRGELRAFQDRGTWRFRTQEIEELARQRGQRSSPDLPLGEAPRPKPVDSPPPKTPAKPADEGEVFDFSLDIASEQVPIGQEQPFGESPSGRRKTASKSDKKATKSPTPKPGSDSDVRLVAEGSDVDIKVGSDSDVKMVKDPGSKSPPPGPKSPTPKPKSGVAVDSGVRLAGPEPSDSDVKIVGVGPEDSNVQIGRQPPKTGTDSDIRLEGGSGVQKAGSDDALLTEEIDLDAEIRKAEEAAQAKKSDPEARALPKPKAPEFPTTSPFELSETDLKIPVPEIESPQAKGPRAPDSSEFDLTPGKPPDSSSDFDLTPAGKDQSPLDLASDEFQLELPDDAVGLGDLPPAKGKASGINLQSPADSGISLEQSSEGSDEIEFELSLDAESTPKPAPAADSDSDSEFELTIDESGGLAPLEEEAPQLAGEEEKDIFETDFDVPALEEESGSQAVALDDADTDLESSDFDLALSDADMVAEEESGSQVVALDDEEAEEGAATVQRPRRKKETVVLEDDEAGVDELMEAPAEGELEEEEGLAPAVAAPAAEWGPVPVIAMLPAVLIMVLLGLMGIEMVQGLTGYSKPGPLTKQIGGLFVKNMPKD